MAISECTYLLNLTVLRIYTLSWRKIRKAGHEGFNARAVVAYQPLQEEYAARLVETLLTDPVNSDAHIRR